MSAPQQTPIDVTIDELAAGGDGVGRDADGRVVFVSRAAPGDRLRVELLESKRRFARGRPYEIVEPSGHRIAPRCPAFGEGCGGCQWQHVTVEAQRSAKQAIVASALRKHIVAGLEVEPLATPVPAYGWRRRARLHWVRRRSDDAAMVGLLAGRSHRVIDVPVCPQLEPAMQGALEVIRAHLAPHLTGKGEIAVAASAAGAIHVVVKGPCAPAAVEALVGRGHVAGAALGRAEWGERIEIEPGLRGSAADFAQASRSGNQELCATVDRTCSPRERARILELYAGGGNLTRVLARGAAEVIAVDTQPVVEPVAGNVVHRQGDVTEIARTLVRKGERFDWVVLDPPRTGARDVAPHIAQLCDRAVYVSCDPATLARDLGVLSTAGLRPRRAWPIDMMPQTSHVEVVTLLER